MRPSHTRFVEAYLLMAQKAKYRPAAPGDGMGNIVLSDDKLADESRLATEAQRYATAFLEEENSLKFYVGCSNFKTNRAFVFAIEAARCLAGGADEVAARLLQLALEEVEERE